MQTDGEKVIQLHTYKGIVLDKENGHLVLVWCHKSDKIITAESKTHPASMFLYKDASTTLQRLLDAGWKITERFEDVKV